MFYIWRLLENDLARSLSNYLEEIDKKLKNSISTDQWQGKIVEYKSNQVILSASGKKLLLCIQKLLHETASVVSPKTTPIVARGIANLIGKYIERCAECATELALNDHQYFSLMSNVMFIIDTFIPDISDKFVREFQRDAVELQTVGTGFEGLIPELFDNFVLTRGEHFSKIRLPFSEPLKSGYPRSSMATREGKATEIVGVTESFISMFVFVARLAEELRVFFFGRVNTAIRVEDLIGKHSNWSSTPAIIGTLLDNIATSFLESDLWDRLSISKDDFTVTRDLRLTTEDVSQIILDLKFFRRCSELSLSAKNQPNLVVSMRESILRNADSIVSKVITSFCSANKLRIDQVLQSSDWFDRYISRAMDRKIVLETDAVGMPISDRTYPFGEILLKIAVPDSEGRLLMDSILKSVTATGPVDDED